MREVVAVVDDSSISRAVRDAAQALGELLDSNVTLVDLLAGRSHSEQGTAGDSGRRTPSLRDETVRLVRCLSSPAVVAAVLSGSSSDIPSNRAARQLLMHAPKPILVVPASCRGLTQIRRLLAPLDADAACAAPLETFLQACSTEPPVELLVLHVFTAASTPPFLDRPYYDLHDLAGEFVRRRLPGRSAAVRWATGPPGRSIAKACRPEIADAVVLSWAQLLLPGRAAVVRAVLAGSELPVLLLPKASTARDVLIDLVEEEADAGSEGTESELDRASSERAALVASHADRPVQ